MEPKEMYYEKKVEKYVTKGFKIFFMIIFFIGLILLAGYVLMHLWNWLMPDLFGIATIGYWQALGIMLMAKIIFGFGNHSSSKHHKSKHRQHKKWDRFCDPKNGGSDWRYYDQFWKEEGKEAFNAYVERTKNQKPNDTQEEN